MILRTAMPNASSCCRGDVIGRPSASVPARPDHLRSLALSAGAVNEARRVAQWRTVPGLGSAIRVDPAPRPAASNTPTAIASSSTSYGAVLDHGLAAVEAACTGALDAGTVSGDVILTVLARRQQPTAPPSITTPDALRLKIEPAADCGRYDSIRKVA